MRRASKCLSLLVSLAAVGTTAAACASSTSPSTTGSSAASAAGGAKQRIAFITINEQDVFFVDLTKGLKDLAAKSDVELAVTDPNGDVTKQIDAVNQYVTAKFDAIIIDPVDGKAVAPALKAAKSAGVKVIAVDGVVQDKTVIDTQVGADNAKVSKDLAGLALKYASSNLPGKPIVVGAATVLQSQIQLQRSDAFMEAMKAGPNVTVKEAVDGGYSPDTAQKAGENLFTATPYMNIAFATGQGTLLGLIAANKAQNRDVKLFGWNLDKTIAAAIKSGSVIATAQQVPADFGTAAMQGALDLLRGKQVGELVPVPVTIVTKDNVDAQTK